MKISVCVPTWEQYGYGKSFIVRALESIKIQTYKNIEIVISDHSKDNTIESVVKDYIHKLPIIYVKNTKNYGNGPANTNNCIRNSSGDILKFLFQDDFFFKNNALELIVQKFMESNTKWIVTGSNHTKDGGKTFFNYMTPKWNDKIPFGVNTISSPSVLSILNDKETFFDENLEMLMDCEFYYQLYSKYGLPYIIGEYLVTNALHANQISTLYKKDLQEEIEIVKNKHNIN